MKQKLIYLILISFVCLFSGGCETLKGASEGFKKDIDGWKKTDDLLQEKLW